MSNLIELNLFNLEKYYWQNKLNEPKNQELGEPNKARKSKKII